MQVPACQFCGGKIQLREKDATCLGCGAEYIVEKQEIGVSLDFIDFFIALIPSVFAFFVPRAALSITRAFAAEMVGKSQEEENKVRKRASSAGWWMAVILYIPSLATVALAKGRVKVQ